MLSTGLSKYKTHDISYFFLMGIQLKKLFPFINFYVFCNEIIIRTSVYNIYKLISFFQRNTNFRYTILSDICGIDYPEKRNRFEVVYNLLSVTYNSRISISTSLNEVMEVNSITNLFEGAYWLEREVWDMYGIFFNGNKDLRRILTDYGFKGHPLRKDFPLTGYTELKYDDFNKKISYNAVSLAQDYRSFAFSNDSVI